MGNRFFVVAVNAIKINLTVLHEISNKTDDSDKTYIYPAPYCINVILLAYRVVVYFCCFLFPFEFPSQKLWKKYQNENKLNGYEISTKHGATSSLCPFAYLIFVIIFFDNILPKMIIA